MKGLRAEDHLVESSISNIQGKEEMEGWPECLGQAWRGGGERGCSSGR